MKETTSHIGFLVKDLDSAIELYTTLLGGQVELRTDFPLLGRELAFVRVGDTLIELMEPNDKTDLESRETPLLEHIAFEVEDLDGLVARMASQGVRCDPPEPRPSVLGGRTTFVLSDKLGVQLQLMGE